MRYLTTHRQPGEEVYLVGNQTLGAAKWYLPDPDPLMHEHLEQSAPIHGTRYWVVICYEPRKRSENKRAMTQPGTRVDESRSFHTSGADVLWFTPVPGVSGNAHPVGDLELWGVARLPPGRDEDLPVDP